MLRRVLLSNQAQCHVRAGLAIQAGWVNAPMSSRTVPALAPAPVSLNQARFARRRNVRVDTKTETQTQTQQQAPQQEQNQGSLWHANPTQEPDPTEMYKNKTGSEVVAADAGLSKFLGKTMMTTAMGVGAAGLVGAGVAVGMLPAVHWGVSLIISLGGILGTGILKPTHSVDSDGHYQTQNSAGRIAAASAVFIGTGLALGPLLAVVPSSILASAGFATMGTVGGMMTFALSRPQGALLKWGAPLFVGLLGLIGISLGGMFFGMSSGVGLALSIGSVGLFSAFTAYDVQQAIHNYKAGNADHLNSAISFFLDVYNLFVNFIRIFSYFGGGSD